MTATALDTMAKCLTNLPTRRDILRSLTGAAFGLSTARGASIAEAKKKRKRRTKTRKPQWNAFGCVDAWRVCKSDDQCCSGICQGTRGKRKCQAHGTGTCDQAGPGLCSAPYPELLFCNNNAECACIQTTAGSNFCYDMRSVAGSECAGCLKDADCESLGFPAGSACAAVSQGRCAGICTGGMMCMVPCGYEPPVPE